MNPETVMLHKFTRDGRSVKVCPFCEVENAMSRTECFICGRNLSDAFVASDYSEITLRGPHPDPVPEKNEAKKKTSSGTYVSSYTSASSDEKEGKGWIAAVVIVLIIIFIIAASAGCSAAEMPRENETVLCDEFSETFAISSEEADKELYYVHESSTFEDVGKYSSFISEMNGDVHL